MYKVVYHLPNGTPEAIQLLHHTWPAWGLRGDELDEHVCLTSQEEPGRGMNFL